MRRLTVFLVSLLLLAAAAAALADGTYGPATYRGGGGGLSKLAVQVELPGNGAAPVVTVSCGLPYAGALAVDCRLVAAGDNDWPRAAAGGDTSAFTIGRHVVTVTPAAMEAYTGDEFTYWIRAKNASNQWVRIGTATVQLEAPVVSNLVALASGTQDVVLSWEPVPGAASYTVTRNGEELTHLWTSSFTAATTYKVGVKTLKDGTMWQDVTTGTWHALAIDATVAWQSGGETQWAHYTSPDLVTWTETTPVDKSNMTVAGYNIDHIWAPHVFFHGGKYRMYYCGVDRTTNPVAARKIERVFYAEAPEGANLNDPTVWTGRKFLIDGDEEGGTTGWAGVTYNCGWSTSVGWAAQCRDPYVVWDETGSRWVMVCCVTSTGSQQAVGVATATNVDGPFTLHGWHTSTTNTKAESMSLYHDGAKWVLLWVNGLLTAWSHGTTAVGQYVFSTSDFSANNRYLSGQGADPMPWPIVRPDGDLWVPDRTATDLDDVRISCAGANAAVNTVLFFGDTYKTRVSPAVVRVYEPATFTEPYLVDHGVTPGEEYTYTVTAEMTAGGTSDMATAAPVRVLETVTWNPAPFTVEYAFIEQLFKVSFAVNDAGIPWQYRLRYAIGPAADCAGLAVLPWGDPVAVSSRLSLLSLQMPNVENEWDYCAAEVQVRPVNGDGTWSAAYCDRAQRIPPITPPGTVQVVNTGGAGGSNTITWDAAAEAHQLWGDVPSWYEVRIITEANVTVNVVVCDELEVRTCTDLVLAGSGFYQYEVRAKIDVDGLILTSSAGSGFVVAP